MQLRRKKTPWRDWLQIGRLIPLTTVLVALAIGVLTLLNLFQATLAEGIIIALLALLATDALVERINLLEKIEAKISAQQTPIQFRDRSELVHIEDMALAATEIAAAGPTLVSLVASHYDFFVQKIRKGCKLRFLLFDPNSSVLQVWLQSQRIATPHDTENTLKVLDALLQLGGVRGKCEVRFTNAYLPFSLVMTNPSKTSGRMNVDILDPKVSSPNRPYIHLTKLDHERWFDFFRDEFEKFWLEATGREKPAG